MNIVAMTKNMALSAAGLFAYNFHMFRRSIPILPERMESPAITYNHLENLLIHSNAVAAYEDGRLLGFLGWWLVDGFRDTDRKTAYCPVWAHAAAPDGARQVAKIYRALYRAASEQWFAAGCQAHAITLLAGDEAARDAWFWNGFGLTVVDALRTLDPIGVPSPEGYTIRKATPADCSALADIEAEHWRHYAQPPTLMTTSGANSAEEFAQILAEPANRIWMAWKGTETDARELAGYIRFEGQSDGATEIVQAPDTTACTGAYTRPAYRGQRVMAALLDAALADYRSAGYARCSVDFESFNPEAASFWTKYFLPVCYSVIRVPERMK